MDFGDDNDSDFGDVRQDLLIPFDVALAPDALHSDDAPSQDQVFQAAIFNGDLERDQEDAFNAQPKRARNLEFYKRMYDRRDAIQAMCSLDHRAEIKFRSSSFVSATSDPDLAWMPHTHFLDLMIVVGDGLGLGALIPNLQIHHNYEMTVDLSQPYRTFSTKFARLGFDAAGCMQYIGRSPASEDVWLAWTPRVHPEDDDDDNHRNVGHPTCDSGKSTAMSSRHYRLSYMFLTKMLQRIGARDVLVVDDYPDVDNDDEYMNATRIP
jgi:hypothetical protein